MAEINPDLGDLEENTSGPIYNPWVPKGDRQVVIQEVLQRMDEISPAEDINIVEGQLVDSLLDGAMTNYLLAADIHKIPLLKEKNYPGDIESEKVQDGVFPVPVDYVRMAWCSSPEWRRDLYESDLMVSGSMAWKMQSLSKFLAASPLKPSIVQLPSLAKDGRVQFKVSPCKEGRLTFVYVPRALPEEVLKKASSWPGFWQSYLWYASHVVLTAMGEQEMAMSALQHAYSYQFIPSGMPVPVRDKKKS